ncbi:MAG: superoxide dismutase [Microgenomates group bacterium]
MFQLPKLAYSFDALEPSIDHTTMEIHYKKHHQAYVDNLNTVLERYPNLSTLPIQTLLSTIFNEEMPETDKIKIRNFGGGHANHTFFWSIMGNKKTPDTDVVKRILDSYGSLEHFKEQFTKSALGLFGSGWVWLVENNEKSLELYTLPNQDSPYLLGHTPILGLDLWEHAYYLKYQNKKADYINNWWSIVTLLP